MDKTCRRCKEPVELYYLVHEEGIFDNPQYQGNGIYTSGRYKVYVPDSIEEAKEGLFILLECDCCPSSESEAIECESEGEYD